MFKNIKINTSTHLYLKIKAAEMGYTVSELANAAIEYGLKNNISQIVTIIETTKKEERF